MKSGLSVELFSSDDYNPSMTSSSSSSEGAPRFATTSWTLVVDAGGQPTARTQQALSALIERYWHPLYAYLRQRGSSVDEAQDLTQAFFARFLEKGFVRDASRERGRFRTFLLACLSHFVSNEKRAARAEKRGGGAVPFSLDFDSAESRYSLEPGHAETPERDFERRWALTVLDRAINRIAAEFAAEGKSPEFEELRPFLTGDLPSDAAATAERLSKTPGAFKVAIHRLRKRYGEALRAEVAETVATPDEIGDEIQSLLSALRNDS